MINRVESSAEKRAVTTKRRSDSAPPTALPPFRGGWTAFHRTRDIRYHPYFRGGISRWGWRFWTQRFTSLSHWLLAVTILFLVIGSSSLEFQIYAPFPYLFSIWIAAVVSARVFRPRVNLNARHADRISVGELLTVEVEVEQRGLTSMPDLWVIPFMLPPGLDAEPLEGAPLPRMVARETARARLGLRCTRRGSHTWSGFRVETDFPFGLLRTFTTQRVRHHVLVYPRFHPIAAIAFPSGRRYQPGGIAVASRQGESFEFVGNREFRDGDNLRDMDWRATARLNFPIIREYREEYLVRVGVILDTHIHHESAYREQENLERAISMCAAISDFMSRSDYLVDLFAVGPELYHIAAGRSLAYLDQILDILACVEGAAEDPIAVLEPEVIEDLANITTVFCVLLDWDAPRRDFIDALVRRGAGVNVLVVRDEPCTLPLTDAAARIVVISRESFETGIEELW